MAELPARSVVTIRGKQAYLYCKIPCAKCGKLACDEFTYNRVYRCKKCGGTPVYTNRVGALTGGPFNG